MDSYVLLFLTRLTNREEGLWVLLGNSNNICYFQKVSFMDESEAINTSSSAIFWTIDSLGASVRQRTRKLEKVGSLSRLVMRKRFKPAENTYNLTCLWVLLKRCLDQLWCKIHNWVEYLKRTSDLDFGGWSCRRKYGGGKRW